MQRSSRLCKARAGFLLLLTLTAGKRPLNDQKDGLQSMQPTDELAGVELKPASRSKTMASIELSHKGHFVREHDRGQKRNNREGPLKNSAVGVAAGGDGGNKKSVELLVSKPVNKLDLDDDAWPVQEGGKGYGTQLGGLERGSSYGGRVRNMSATMSALVELAHEAELDDRWKCNNICIQCPHTNGKEMQWEIRREQSTSKKMGRVLMAGLSVAAILTGVGPIVAAIGGAAGVAVASVTVVGGAAVATGTGSALMNVLSKEKPFCPKVSFKERAKSSFKDPYTPFDLVTLNIEELLSLDLGKFTVASVPWALACNYMPLAIEKWEAHDSKTWDKHYQDHGRGHLTKSDIIDFCGMWLCNGMEPVKDDGNAAAFGQCKGGTYRERARRMFGIR